MKEKQSHKWWHWIVAIVLISNLTSAQAGATFTFDHALKIAMQSSPLISSGIAAIHSANGQLLQSKTYPNPSLDASVENIAGSGTYKGFNAAETTIMLTQPLSLGGKRQANQAVQQGRLGLSQLSLKDIRASLYVHLGIRYIDVLYAKNWLQTTSRTVSLNQDIVGVLKRKIKAGSGSPLDLMTAQIQLSRSKIDHRLAHQALNATWKRLILLMGKRRLRYQTVEDRGLPHKLASYQKLINALTNSPMWKTQVMKSDVAYRQIVLSKKQAWPDLTIGVGARHFSDTHDNSLVAEFSLPLPLYDRNQGNTMSRLADYKVALSDQQQKMIELKSTLSRLYQQAFSSRYQARIISQQILPKAKQAVKSAKKGYFQGRYPYVTLANAQTTLLQAEKNYWRTHTDFDKALVEIQGLIGKRIN